MSTDPTTYPERAGEIQKQARIAACEEASVNWLAAKKAAGDVTQNEIACLNFMRAAGDAIAQAAGRQLTFGIESKEFCRKELLPLLPEGMNMAALQACVHIASRLPKPIKTKEELASVKKELQLVFEALGVSEAPRRKELQESHPRNLFSEFVSKAAGFGVLFAELEKVEPMQDWSRNKLTEFLDYARPVKEKIELAEKLASAF